MTLDAEQVVRQLRRGDDSDITEIVSRGDRLVGPWRNNLADEFAIFAYVSGGILPCGVRDSGQVVGMSRPRQEEVNRPLVEVSTDAIDPPMRRRVRRRESSEGRRDPMETAVQGGKQ